MAPGRIEFVILRTGCSPPAALHHASLRRSGIRLQAGERLPGEDFHLSDYACFQAHNPTDAVGGRVHIQPITGPEYYDPAIGVGRHDWFRSPSLRTGQAILPHPALQLVVHPLRD